MVQRKIAVVPGTKPVTVVVGEFGLVMVAVPKMIDHVPVPTVGVLAVIVVVVTAHNTLSVPAFAEVGFKSTFTTALSEFGIQPGAETVHCTVYEPPATSPVNVEVGEFGLVTVAVPEVTVHVPVPTVGAVAERLAAVVPHTIWSTPAFAVEGALVIVTNIVSRTVAQGELAFEARMKRMTPAVMSAALGVYTALRVVLFGAKVPVPLLVHIPPVTFVTLPAKVICALLAQTVWLTPALIIGKGLMTITTEKVEVQPFESVMVSVTVLFPAVL